jgi:hypothetical protein
MSGPVGAVVGRAFAAVANAPGRPSAIIVIVAISATSTETFTIIRGLARPNRQHCVQATGHAEDVPTADVQMKAGRNRSAYSPIRCTTISRL